MNTHTLNVHNQIMIPTSAVKFVLPKVSGGDLREDPIRKYPEVRADIKLASLLREQSGFKF